MSDSDPYWALRVILRMLWVVAGFPAMAILWGLEHAHVPWWITTGWISAYLGVGSLLFGRGAKRRAQAALAGHEPPAP